MELMNRIPNKKPHSDQVSHLNISLIKTLVFISGTAFMCSQPVSGIASCDEYYKTRLSNKWVYLSRTQWLINTLHLSAIVGAFRSMHSQTHTLQLHSIRHIFEHVFHSAPDTVFHCADKFLDKNVQENHSNQAIKLAYAYQIVWHL